MQTKVCQKCGKEFPATIEYFYFRNNAPESPCRECRRKSSKEYRLANPDKVREQRKRARQRNRDKYNEKQRMYYAKRHPKPEPYDDGFKTCKKCGRTFPATNEFFHADKNGKGGLRSKCKECARDEGRQRYYENREAALEASHRYYSKHKEQIADRYKQWYQNNREAALAYSAKYRAEHPKEKKEPPAFKKCKICGRVLPRTDEYWGSKKNYNASYYFKAWCRDCESEGKKLERSRMDQEKLRAQYAQHNHKRWSAARNAPATLTKLEWAEILGDFDGKCAYCGKDGAKLQREHFFPLSKGGAYSKGNIIPACPKCNASKNDKLFEEWYPNQPFYSPEREAKILNYIKEVST